MCINCGLLSMPFMASKYLEGSGAPAASTAASGSAAAPVINPCMLSCRVLVISWNDGSWEICCAICMMLGSWEGS